MIKLDCNLRSLKRFHWNHLHTVASSSVTNVADIKCSAALHICRYINETHWPRCSAGRRPLWGAASGPAMIALFSAVHSFPLIISLFQTSPVVPSGQSHSQTRPCLINILSYFLTVGSPRDTSRSPRCTVLANYVNTTGRSRWFQALLC